MVVATKIGFLNFWLLIPYIWIRYKTFICEDNRKLLDEFNLYDLQGTHYVLLLNNQVIGTARVLYTGDIAQIGRFIIIKQHRRKGFGKHFMTKLVNLIQNTHKARMITLLAFKPSLVDFYAKLGFKKDGLAYFNGLPFTRMNKSCINLFQ